jgi:hypothetical protein
VAFFLSFIDNSFSGGILNVFGLLALFALSGRSLRISTTIWKVKNYQEYKVETEERIKELAASGISTEQ